MPRQDLDDPSTASATATHRHESDWDASGRSVRGDDDAGQCPQRTAEVQLALVSMGYGLHGGTGTEVNEDDGVDGIWGRYTRDAVQQFQEDMGLESTGDLNHETYAEIMRAYGQALTVRGAQEEIDLHGDDLQSRSPDPASREIKLGELEGLEGLVPGEASDEPIFGIPDDSDLLDTDTFPYR